MVTKIINNKILVLKIPAIIVRQSPINGTHANRRAQTPYFWYSKVALEKVNSLIGNHFFS
jgi:hypothetical protein